MKLIRLLWRILWNLKTIVISFILVCSLVFNIILFVGGSFFSILNSGFEAVTGLQTIASRNRAEIVELGDNLVVERQAKRELKQELAETSGDLVVERKAKRELKGQVAEISGDLVVERKAKRELKEELVTTTSKLVAEQRVKRELKGQIAEISGDLLIERNAKHALKSELADKAAQLTLERTTQRTLKSQIRDLANGLVPFKGKKVALKAAVEETAENIGKRSLISAKRNVASMPGEALPWVGTAVIAGVTALELYDLCATVKDMTELKRAFNPTLDSNENELAVCSIKVPPKEVIIASVKASPKVAWEKAKEVTPSLEEIKDMELPDVSFKDMWESSKSGTGALTDKVKTGTENFTNKIKKWWE